MGILQIELFGGVHITHTNWQTEITLTREIQELLGYLLLERHRVHSREVLAHLFWGEYSQEKARGSLNTALWKLKKALEPEGISSGTYLKNNHQGGISFNRESDYWLDIGIFEDKITRILTNSVQNVEKTTLAELESILILYKGDLLEGCYKDWVLQAREHLRGLYLNSLIYLLQYYRCHGVHEKAIAYGQQILNLDPLREEIHRELMRVYTENGQRALAIRQYHICCSILAKELGILPMEDTQVLYKQIIIGVDNNCLALDTRDVMNFSQALRQLREANQTIEIAREQIQQALQLISTYSERFG